MHKICRRTDENDMNVNNIGTGQVTFQRSRDKLAVKTKTLQISIIQNKQKNQMLKASLAQCIQQNQSKTIQKKRLRDNLCNLLKKLPAQVQNINNLVKGLKQTLHEKQNIEQNYVDDLQTLQIENSKLLDIKSVKIGTVQNIKKKVRIAEQEIRKAKFEINRLNIEIGAELSISSKAKSTKSLLKRTQQHRRLQSNIGSMSGRVANAKQKFEQLKAMSKKLNDQVQSKNKDVNQIRKKNEDMEIHSLQLSQIEKKLDIQKQLLANFYRENKLLRQKLEKVTGEKYLTENLAVHEGCAGSVYRSSSDVELQSLIQQKIGIIFNQEEQLERLALEIDKIALLIRQCDKRKYQRFEEE